MDNKIFLIPCNFEFGCATVVSLAEDGELLGNEFGGIFGNGFCSGAIPLQESEEYLNKYDAKYGEDNYEIIYVNDRNTYKGLKEAIDKCPELTMN